MEIIAWLLGVMVTMAQPVPSAADIAWVAEGDFCEPETVLALPDNTLLVSNVCDFKQDGNGYLSRLQADGQVLDWHFVEGLDAPLGMAIHQQQVYVIDRNRLKVFDWPAFSPAFTIEMETSVANDLAISPAGDIFVTDTAKGEVIHIRQGGQQSVLTGAANFENANGIAFHDGDLYVGGQRLWRVDLQSNEIATIGPEWISDIDGIEFEADGTMQITPVAGPLIRYRGDDDIEVLAGPGVSSANHGYAEKSGLALIPTGFDNTVIAIRVPKH